MLMEMDVVDLEGMKRQLKDLLDAGKVEITVLQEHGPGGGWPVVRFDVWDGDSAHAILDIYWGVPRQRAEPATVGTA